MDLKSVIEDLVYDKGLEKDKVIDSVCLGLSSALNEKNPGYHFQVFISKTGLLTSDKFLNLFDVFVQKRVVEHVLNKKTEISFVDAKKIDSTAELNKIILIPWSKTISRVEIVSSKGFISESIKKLEQEKIYNSLKNNVGNLVSGSVHKVETGGVSVTLGDTIAFLPQSFANGLTDVRSGAPVKAILKQVLPFSGKNAQIILDRSTVAFVVKLMEVEVPEIFDNIVEIVKAERIPGYRTKVVLKSKSKNIDPVGACIGMAGGRIKAIRSELGEERIDLIPWIDDKEMLLKRCLKTRDSDKEVNKVVFHSEAANEYAEVWVDQDLKSMLIGKGGGNISLASRIIGMQIRVHQESVE